MRNGCPGLKSMVGEIIIARIAALDEENTVLVRLHRVEHAGIWIESQDFTDNMMEKFSLAVSKTTLLLFVPFPQINYLITSVESISLSETRLGLAEDG